VGLGNPGPGYEATRHNAGFLVLDFLALQEGLIFESAASLECYAGRELCWARSKVSPYLLAKPLAFMNRSGDVVAPLARWAGLDPAAILVVYDDIDLPLGRLRIRPHGGTGGHRGVESIVEQLGTDRFPRLRVGIGPPTTDAARFVLERFEPSEQPILEAVVEEASAAVLDWLLSGDIDRCMTRFHSRWNQGPIGPHAGETSA
jgi:PTH1 family peptidyl-tRNA hydrolase